MGFKIELKKKIDKLSIEIEELEKDLSNSNNTSQQGLEIANNFNKTVSKFHILTAVYKEL